MATSKTKQPKAPRVKLSGEAKLRRQLRTSQRICCGLFVSLAALSLLFWLQGPASRSYIAMHDESSSSIMQNLVANAYQLTSNANSLKLYALMLFAVATLMLVIYLTCLGVRTHKREKKQTPVPAASPVGDFGELYPGGQYE